MTLHHWRNIALGCGLLVAVGGGLLLYEARPPSLNKNGFTSVQLELRATGNNPSLTTEITDVAVIQNLSQVLEDAAATPEHRCANFAWLRFRKPNGSTLTLGIILGNDPSTYEYRCNGFFLFRVSRPELLAALAPFRVPVRRLADPYGP